MNFYQELGPLVLGSRLKRISETFLSEVNKVYIDLDLPFEASWFGIFYLLGEHKKVSINEIAERLEVSHSAISQLVKTLDNKGLLIIEASTDDGRKKVISLSKDGLLLLKNIKPIWKALNKSMADVLKGNPLIENLLKIENSFLQHGLNERIKNKLNV